MQPLISIITVTYNAAAEVGATMKSVSEQTFKDYEHLIVDGLSTDGTLDVVAGYQSDRLRVFSRKDSGIYHGMNRGLKYAEGKYVLFLNAGDRFADAGTLERYAAEAKAGADIIYGDTEIVDASGRVLRRRHLDAPGYLTYRSYLGGMLVCHQAFMVRKAIAPAYSREFELSADYDWCLNCIAASKITQRKNLKRVTIHYLDAGVSQKRKLASLRERFEIMRRHFGLLNTVKAHLTFIPRALKRRIDKIGRKKGGN
ncbi:MAG: glycosyltransferase [Muribaculaceae bacterium]|nr:glycosyltransferase [Muribaculaceae bacterium]